MASCEAELGSALAQYLAAKISVDHVRCTFRYPAILQASAPDPCLFVAGNSCYYP